MSWQANLTIRQHAALIDVFNRVDQASDIPLAISTGSVNETQLGVLQSYQFYPATPNFPFYFAIKTSLMTIIMANGTSSQSQFLIQAQAYITNRVIGGGFNGVSYAVGQFASLLVNAFNNLGTLPDKLLVFCGHSYGAAAAFNAARAVIAAAPPVTVEAVGWGGPKWAFSSVVPDSVSGLVETNWALNVDVVPSLPPALNQVPPFYALLPLAFSVAMLRYWSPIPLRGLDAQGNDNDLSRNPWLGVLAPTSVLNLVRNMDSTVNTFHGSSSYATAIGAYAARVAGPNPAPIPPPVHGSYPGGTTPQAIAAGTGTGLNYLRSLPAIINPAGLTDPEILYRVRRKRRKYYVCRGTVYLGQAKSKADARTVAKGARTMASANAFNTPAQLAGNDQLVITAYNKLFKTVLI